MFFIFNLLFWFISVKYQHVFLFNSVILICYSPFLFLYLFLHISCCLLRSGYKGVKLFQSRTQRLFCKEENMKYKRRRKTNVKRKSLSLGFVSSWRIKWFVSIYLNSFIPFLTTFFLHNLFFKSNEKKTFFSLNS